MTGTSLPIFQRRPNAAIKKFVIRKKEIADTINILLITKTAGSDGISHLLLENSSDTISEPLTIVFKFIFSINVFSRYLENSI